MDEVERVFRDGLRAAAERRPPAGPVELDAITASVSRPTGRRPARMIGLAAAVALVAGLVTLALRPPVMGSVERATPTASSAAAGTNTLLVANRTGAELTQFALVLPDGTTHGYGNIPSGGELAVPIDWLSSPSPVPSPESTPVTTPAVVVTRTGECLVTVQNGSDGTKATTVPAGTTLKVDEVMVAIHTAQAPATGTACPEVRVVIRQK